MQQNKISILSTRSLDDELILDAESKDISIEVVPFIKTEPISSRELEKRIKKASMSTTVVFTSANAVEIVASELKEQKPQWKIFCIGYGTRRIVAKHFGDDSIAGVADSAKELAKAVVDANVSQVVFFCGDRRRDELPALLKQNKVNLEDIVVYNTIATPQKIEKKYDGILFFSPSAVKSFFDNNIPGDQTVLFAIGGTTADEIKTFSTNKVVISDMPEAKGLLDKIISYFQVNSIHH